jgi:hypothetical protein
VYLALVASFLGLPIAGLTDFFMWKQLKYKRAGVNSKGSRLVNLQIMVRTPGLTQGASMLRLALLKRQRHGYASVLRLCSGISSPSAQVKAAVAHVRRLKRN